MKNLTKNYDLTFIGSGISCTLPLLSIFEKIQECPKNIKLKILIIEKNPNLWTGIPYGNRSSKTALTITTLGEFLHPSQKKSFLAWFEKNKNQILHDLSRIPNGEFQDWIYHNLDKLNPENLSEVYIPRYLFGNYLKDKIQEFLSYPIIMNRVELNTIRAEAIQLDKNQYGYEILLKDSLGRYETIRTQKAVLSLGHLPKKSVLEIEPISKKGYYADPYFPNMDSNMEEAKNRLEKINPKAKNLLVIGSNASALELLYILCLNQDIISSVDKITVLSPSGRLPAPIEEENSPFEFFNLIQLKSELDLTAFKLMDAIEKDVQLALKNQISIGNIYYSLSDLVVEFLKKLKEDQRKIFHNVYGMDFTKLIRRAGIDYWRVVKPLVESGKIELISGELTSLKHSNFDSVEGITGHRMTYLKNGVLIHGDRTYSSIFNCSGFNTISQSDSPLIQYLVKKGICRTNCTDRGFDVNDDLEANDSLYVMGPLLGSLYIDSYKYWHVENAKRITELGGKLAQHILENTRENYVFPEGQIMFKA